MGTFDFSAESAQSISLEMGINSTDQFMIINFAPGQSIAIQNGYSDQGQTYQFADESLDQRSIMQLSPAVNVLGTGNDDVIYGSGFDDTIYGMSGADTLFGSAGNDWLEGGSGDDIYHFGRGSGQDEILDIDTAAGNVDVIQLGQGILETDVELTRNGEDLRIALKGSDDYVDVNSYFLGTNGFAKVETLRFADGTEWNLADQSEFVTRYEGDSSITLSGTSGNDVLTGTVGDDVLVGGSGHDRLIGGEGSDSLNGGVGSDVYVYSRGDGSDVIQDADSSGIDVDVIQFTGGIVPQDIEVVRADSGDLEILISGTSDRITVKGWFASPQNRIEKLKFADGTTLDTASYSSLPVPEYNGTFQSDSIRGNDSNNIIYAGGGNDSIYGRRADDALYGEAGDDNLSGGYGNDRLDGGSGNDFLEGDNGDDTYYFGRDYGEDTIHEWAQATGEGTYIPYYVDDWDRVILKDLVPSDVEIIRRNNQLVVMINDTDDVLTIGDRTKIVWPNGRDSHQIEELIFADGTSILTDTLVDMPHTYAGTEGDDSLTSWGYYNGTLGSHDRSVMYGYGGNDRIMGGRDDDEIYGGEGEDHLSGNDGDDRFYYEVGDGRDGISGGKGDDTIIFGSNINLEDISVIPFGEAIVSDLGANGIYIREKILLQLPDVNDQLFLNQSYSLDASTGEIILSSVVNGAIFEDGRSLDFSRPIGTPRGYFGGSSAEDHYSDMNGVASIVNTMGGDDIIDSAGGDDWLVGGLGKDVYFFGNGYGNDVIYDMDGGEIHLRDGLTLDDLVITAENNSLLIRLAATGESLTIKNFYSSEVNSLVFSDGTSIDLKSDLELVNYLQIASGISNQGHSTFANVLTGSQGDDFLIASAGNNRFEGAGGDDGLHGGFGNDTYYFAIGDGRDEIFDDSGVDRVIFAPGIGPDDIYFEANPDFVVRVGAQGDAIKIYNGADGVIEEYVFDDGTVLTHQEIWGRQGGVPFIGTEYGETLLGSPGDDEMTGNQGDDTVVGGLGDDRYYFDLGDGVDVLSDSSGSDIISFGAGIRPADVLVQEFRVDSGWDAEVSFTGSSYLFLSVGQDGDEIRFETTSSPIESFEFTDGRMLTLQELIDLHGGILIYSDPYSSGDVEGSTANERINGTDGPDTLIGGGGNDTIDGGSGNDYIIITGDGSSLAVGGYGEDTIVFNAPIMPSEIGYSGIGIGGPGSDHYVFNPSMHQSRIRIYDDSVSGQQNRLSIGSGVSQGSVRLGLGSLLLSIGDTGNEIHLENFDPADVFGNRAIDYFEFDDGTVLTYEQLLGRGFDIPGTLDDDTLDGTNTVDRVNGLSGNDLISAGDGNDVIAGGQGNDVLAGGEGDDQYLFESGDGVDTIKDIAGLDQIRFGEDISTDSLYIKRIQNNLVIEYGDGDELFLDGWFDGRKIESVVFDNGSTLTAAELESSVDEIVAGNSAPELTGSIEDQERSEDELFEWQVPQGMFVDADGDTLSYSASLVDGSALPDWLSFDSSTRTFSGVPSNDDVGELEITVMAADSSGAAVSDSFMLKVANVNDAPVLVSPIESQETDEDAAFSFALPAGTFTDVDAGDVLAYSASLPNRGALPDWLSFDPDTNVFSGTPLNEDVGILSLVVTATDLAGVSTNATFNLEVSNVNDAPEVVAPYLDQSVLAYQTFSIELPQYAVVDPDVGDLLSYEATMSDGISLPDWLSFDAESLTFTGTAYGGAIGDLGIRVVATDSGGASVSSDFTLTIGAYGNVVLGTQGGDRLFGGSEADTLVGFGGRDLLFGRNGADVLDAGAGNDRLFGGRGDDLLLGGDGDDRLRGGAGADRLIAGDGNDILHGGNELRGFRSLFSRLRGWWGRSAAPGDTFEGGAGNDQIHGSTGNDTYLFNVGDGEDIVTDLGGNDVLSFGPGVSEDQLLFERTRNDLKITITGTHDSVTVKNWYRRSGSGRIERIEMAGGGALEGGEIDGLVSAMAAFDPQPAGRAFGQERREMRFEQFLTAHWKAS